MAERLESALGPHMLRRTLQLPDIYPKLLYEAKDPEEAVPRSPQV